MNPHQRFLSRRRLTDLGPEAGGLEEGEQAGVVGALCVKLVGNEQRRRDALSKAARPSRGGALEDPE